MPKAIYFYGIVWIILFYISYCKDKYIYTYEAFTDEDRNIIQNNIAFVRRAIKNMPDFRSKSKSLLKKLGVLYTRTFNAFITGNALEMNIIRRMEEEVKDAADDGKDLSNRRNKLRRLPTANISYFKN